MASLTRSRGQIPGPLHLQYYTQRASAGLILTEATLIEQQGTEWNQARKFLRCAFAHYNSNLK